MSTQIQMTAANEFGEFVAGLRAYGINQQSWKTLNISNRVALYRELKKDNPWLEYDNFIKSINTIYEQTI